MFKFEILKKDAKSKARVGEIHTSHGAIETPNFVPVGTRATVRSLSPQDLREAGAQIIFGNTYHLHLRPGEDVVAEFEGLGKFMGWTEDGPHFAKASRGKPTITDSGGFQVFSLGNKRRKTQNNTQNKTEIDGCLTHVLRDARQPFLISKSNFPSSLSESRLTVQKRKLEEGEQATFSSLKNDQSSVLKKQTDQVRNKEELPTLVKITDDGVTFRSHIDGSLHTFTPEKSIEIQQKLGADIILVFDECAPYPFTHESTKKAMERTHDWSIRCLEYSKRLNIKNQISKPKLKAQNFTSKESCPSINSGLPPSRWRGNDLVSSNGGIKQALYGIVQGGVYRDLREESAKFIGSQDFDGIAIGGVSVGESKKEMKEAVDWSVPFLPEEKPRHLLGVGEIDDLFSGVERGMDTFDCVIPTRFGRYGIAFVEPFESEEKGKYRINLPKAIYAKDKGPISKNCKCSTCKNYTRGYLNHLFRSDELLGYRLVSYHNVYFILNLMKEIRKSILEDRFEKLKKEWVE